MLIVSERTSARDTQACRRSRLMYVWCIRAGYQQCSARKLHMHTYSITHSVSYEVNLGMNPQVAMYVNYVLP